MQPEALYNAKVFDRDGHKVGKIEHVYLDDETNAPSWMTVSTGMFGGKEAFVPVQGVREVEGDLMVPYTKEFIKEAPPIDTLEEIGEGDEAALRDYYGLSFTHAGEGSVAAAATGKPADPAGQAAMTRPEERLRVGREEVERGRARLRKYVVTEHEVPSRNVAGTDK